MTAQRCICAGRSRRPSRAFTLIEVVVALAIVALALAAVVAGISQMVDAANGMKERTYAAWIAHNRIAELRLQNVVPEVSESSGEITYAGRDWSWEAVVSETGVENLFRVEVTVFAAGSSTGIRTVTGFVGEPTAPGQSNFSWMSGSQATGQDR